MNSKTGPYLSIFVRCLMALCKEDPSLCTLHAIVSHLLRFVLSGATLKRNRSRDLWVRKKLTVVTVLETNNNGKRIHTGTHCHFGTRVQRLHFVLGHRHLSRILWWVL